MAISFNSNSVFNLKPIPLTEMRKDISALFVQGEEPVMAFKTVRDQLVFTNKRIIAMDVQGLTGKRISFASMPYAKVQFFSVQTQGFMEIFPDSELFLSFSNGYTATFEFKGDVDIAGIGRMISEYVL